MKKKFSSMWRVGIALVMVLSLGLVMAAPAAATVSSVTVTVNPTTLSTAAEYTIGFTTTSDLSATTPDDIRVEFPSDTTVPTTIAMANVTVNGNALTVDATAVDRLVTLKVPVDVPAGTVTVVFATAAGILNPSTAATDYTLDVCTSKEVTPVTSSVYTITTVPPVVPDVTSVEPNAGNVGDTMWVEVKGTNFTGTTEACTTTLNFGTGITVVPDSYHWISTGEIDCQVTINASGAARNVVATTAAGTGTIGAPFTPNAAGTAQVDVWLKYTPDDAIFDSETLVFDATTATITLGIAEATAGTSDDPQVLIVHADTYVENPVVNYGYVTIKSLSGAATTIIDGSGGIFGVTLGGIGQTIEDLTINRGGTAGGEAGVKLTEVGNDFTIKDCTFSDWGRTGDEVATGKNDAVIGGYQHGVIDTTITGGLIEGNTFTGNSRTAIWLQTTGGGTCDNVTIKDNQFLSCLQPSDGHGMRLQGDLGNTIPIVVQGNTISDMSGTAIILRGSVTGAEATITGNSISGCYNGIDTTAVWVLKVYKNTITSSDENGIRIQDGAQGTKVIEYNDISGNTGTVLIDGVPRSVYGLNNEDTDETITAKYNWWGHIGGPGADAEATTPSTALGNGDVISTGVDYDPWLTEDYDTVITDGIRSYGSDAIALEAGWNTLSVPCGLKGSAATFGEIQAMGDYLDDFVGGYWYDAAVPQWKGISSATMLEPGKGFYIQMSAASRFPVLYFDGGLHLPAYGMSAGWNLIGAMFGIDRAATPGDGDYGVATAGIGGEDEDEKDVATALASIWASASVIVSPSVPGQLAEWATTATGEDMYVGEAYWVFMTADGTLAGFEVTPFYFTWSAP